MLFGIFLDENFPEALVRPLRRDGVDVLTVSEAARKSFPDEEQLEFATTYGRVVLTFDVRDFSVLAAKWAREGRIHSGILLTNQRSIAELHTGVMRLWREETPESMANTVRWLSK